MSTFKVDLRGVVDLLSSAIYSSPRVYLRELIQNAVDAVTARRAIDPGYRSHGVLITPAGVDGASLRVRDDGIGLTAEEITEFLASVGSSLKRDSFGLPASGMLGRFGIGLLSALMVGDTIIVRTQSATGGPSLEWRGHADGTYDLRELDERLPVGTEVTVLPRADDNALVKRSTVVSLATLYARYLAVPIAVAGDHGADTISEPPPFLSTDPHELMAFGTEVLGGVEPFAVIPIDLPQTGTRGVAYVLREPVPPNNAGVHQVYCSRMLVTDRCREIAPDWAFFVRCVVDSTGLSPTASRESLVADDVLAATREGIGRAVRAWLAALAEQNPDALAAFVYTHYLGLKALAVHDDEIAPLIVRLLPLETSRGQRSIGEILEYSSQLRFVRTTDQFRQVTALSASSALVINATYTWDLDVLRRLPELIPGVSVAEISVQDVLDRLDPVTGPDRGAATSLENRATSALAARELSVAVRSSGSPDVPSFLLTDPDLLRRTERQRARGAGNRWSRVLDVLDSVNEAADATAGARLLLNWANPLVRRLASVTDDTVFGRAVGLLHLQAILATGRPLTSKESSLLTQDLSDLLLLAITPPTEQSWMTN